MSLPAPHPDAPRRFTLRQVARILGCSPDTVTRHVEAGNLPAVDVKTRKSHAYRISPADLEQFIRARLTGQVEA